MKFVTYLCLILFTIQLSMEDDTSEDFIPYDGEYLSVQDIVIPKNSLWRGIILETIDSVTYSGTNWFIHYLHSIPQDSPIRLDYTVQGEEKGWLWTKWTSLYHGSILLCHKAERTQDASILGIVRQILDIPRGCPVPAGSTAYTYGRSRQSSDVLSFKGKFLLLRKDIKSKKIRILINIWDSSSTPPQKLFTGSFYIDHLIRV